MDSSKITIIGLGGAGVNILKSVVDISENSTKHYWDTDTVSLDSIKNQNEEKYLLGRTLVRGLGTGGDLEIGQKIWNQEQQDLLSSLNSPRVVILVFGLGGGTGGAIGIALAEALVGSGVLVIALVASPFLFEGNRKIENANTLLKELDNLVDLLINIPNKVLSKPELSGLSARESFSIINQWFCQTIQALTFLAENNNLLSIDFATFKRFLTQGGIIKTVSFSLAKTSHSDLLEVQVKKIKEFPLFKPATTAPDALLLYIFAGESLSLEKISKIVAYWQNEYGSDCEIFVGATTKADKKDQLLLTHIAVNYSNTRIKRSPTSQSAKNLVQELPSSLPEHPSKILHEKITPNQKTANQKQEEFSFASKPLEHGYFQNVPETLINEKNLDLPTYYRIGLKIRTKPKA